jgi:hypothetical protein
MGKKRQRGIAFIEFTIVGVPIVFLTTSITEMSLESWNFHSMVYAIEVADRYACDHGRTCSKNGNTCTIRVQDVASLISHPAPGLDSSLMNVTLTTHSTSTNCLPLNACFTNTTQFPSTTDNGVGLDIKISATCAMHNPVSMLWFGSAGTAIGTFTVGTTTRQNIVY